MFYCMRRGNWGLLVQRTRGAALALGLILCFGLLTTSASAAGGALIIGGDDLPLHGSYTAGANEKGWLYIQKAIDHLATCATRPNDGSIAALGVTDSLVTGGGDAGAAIHYAAGVALAKSVEYVEGAPAIHTYLLAVAAGTKRPAVIWIPQNYDITNQLNNAETAQLATDAAILRDFVNSGGSIMAHTEGNYPGLNPWIGVIVPGMTEVNGCNATGAFLTLAGNTALPGVLNSDINSTAGPCHTNFINIGTTLQVLAGDGSGGGGLNYIVGTPNCNTTLPGPSVYLNKDFQYHKLDSNPDPNNFEMVVEGAHIASNFTFCFNKERIGNSYVNDGGPPCPTATPYPNAVTGPNTLLTWTFNTITDGDILHVGLSENASSLHVLAVFWTSNSSVLQCAHQINIEGSTSGTVTLSSPIGCEFGNLYALDLAVEYYTDPVPLDQLNGGSLRDPIRTDVIPGNPENPNSPILVLPGGSVTLRRPPVPSNARFQVFTYRVSTSPTGTAPDNTHDFWQFSVPTDTESIPTLSEWGMIALVLLLGTTGAYVVLRRRKRIAG